MRNKAIKYVMLFFTLDGYDTSNVDLKWMDASPVEFDQSALKLPQFELVDIENVSCKESYKTGSMWKQKYIQSMGFHSQKAYTHSGASSSQIILLSAYVLKHFAWELQLIECLIASLKQNASVREQMTKEIEERIYLNECMPFGYVSLWF